MFTNKFLNYNDVYAFISGKGIRALFGNNSLAWWLGYNFQRLSEDISFATDSHRIAWIFGH